MDWKLTLQSTLLTSMLNRIQVLIHTTYLNVEPYTGSNPPNYLNIKPYSRVYPPLTSSLRRYLSTTFLSLEPYSSTYLPLSSTLRYINRWLSHHLPQHWAIFGYLLTTTYLNVESYMWLNPTYLNIEPYSGTYLPPITTMLSHIELLIHHLAQHWAIPKHVTYTSLVEPRPGDLSIIYVIWPIYR
jgi:hypothetical protein